MSEKEGLPEPFYTFVKKYNHLGGEIWGETITIPIPGMGRDGKPQFGFYADTTYQRYVTLNIQYDKDQEERTVIEVCYSFECHPSLVPFWAERFLGIIQKPRDVADPYLKLDMFYRFAKRTEFYVCVVLKKGSDVECASRALLQTVIDLFPAD